MFIPDHGYPISDPGSRIPDPTIATKEKGENFLYLFYLFCSHKYHKIKKYFIFELVKENIGSIFKDL